MRNASIDAFSFNNRGWLNLDQNGEHVMYLRTDRIDGWHYNASNSALTLFLHGGRDITLLPAECDASVTAQLDDHLYTHLIGR